MVFSCTVYAVAVSAQDWSVCVAPSHPSQNTAIYSASSASYLPEACACASHRSPALSLRWVQGDVCPLLWVSSEQQSTWRVYWNVGRRTSFLLFPAMYAQHLQRGYWVCCRQAMTADSHVEGRRTTVAPVSGTTSWHNGSFTKTCSLTHTHMR